MLARGKKAPLTCSTFPKAQVADQSTHKVTGPCVQAGYGVQGFFLTCMRGLLLKRKALGLSSRLRVEFFLSYLAFIGFPGFHGYGQFWSSIPFGHKDCVTLKNLCCTSHVFRGS
jgi:hypothetical protein